MTRAELQAIRARIEPTICRTWRGEVDGAGEMVERVEGRISADDFMALFAEIDRLNLSISNLKGGDYARIGASYPCT